MKNLKLIYLLLLLITTCFSCMIEEEEEIIACSCDTTIYDETGFVISNISSALEAPITGNCSDHNSKVVDIKTGYTTRRTCIK